MTLMALTDDAGDPKASAPSERTEGSAMSVAFRIVVFLPIVAIWLLIDTITKDIANEHAVGEVFGELLFGAIDLKLVRNTGGAWGMLGDMTFALGVVTVIICLVILLFVIFYKEISPLGVAALALVFAGGLGNAIDRFEYGYVIDMIHTTFMDFPVFNFADIGVTCGIILFLISIFFGGNAEDAAAAPKRRSASGATDAQEAGE